MTDAVTAALKAAEAQADTVTSQTVNAGGAVTVVHANANAVGAVAQPGRRLTSNDRVEGGMAVDEWIKFSPMGTVVIGTSNPPKQFDKIKVQLALSEIAFAHGICYGTAPNLTYVKTYDGQVSARGKAWAEELAIGQRVKPGLRPYNAWDLPMVLMEDVGEFKAGTRLGYSTVWSSSTTFIPVYDKAVADFGPDGVILLEITCKAINEPGKNYGLAQFKLLGQADMGE